MTTITKDDVKEYIKNMPVFELAQLIKELEEELGVTAAAPMAAMPMAMPMGAAASAGAGAEPAAEEKSEFDVVITGVGDKKIQVIKVVRAITALGLKEAKQLVDELPGKVKEAIPKEEAAKIAKELEEAGATVEVR